MTHPASPPRRHTWTHLFDSPRVREILGHLRDPFPIVIALAGLTLAASGYLLPVVKGPKQSDPTEQPPPATEVFGPEGTALLALLVLTVVAAMGWCVQRRWRFFGRMASVGLAVVAGVSAYGKCLSAIAAERESLDTNDLASHEATEKLLAQVHIGPGVGLYIGGLLLLALSTIFISPYRPQQAVPAAPVARRPQSMPARPSPAAARPTPEAHVTVTDDPPSNSIYMRPKKP